MGIGAWSWGDRSGYWGYGQGYGKDTTQHLIHSRVLCFCHAMTIMMAVVVVVVGGGVC
jgi:hypothetical protein